MENIVVWAQEVVFIHVLLRYLDIDVGWDMFCIWVELPYKRDSARFSPKSIVSCIATSELVPNNDLNASIRFSHLFSSF